MRVALFVPCYVDQLRPGIGLAALDLLGACGFDVAVIEEVVCCGQPFLTAGEEKRAAQLAKQVHRAFASFEAVVTPSGSCAATLRRHLSHLVPDVDASPVAERTFELCEFLFAQDALPSPRFPFPRRVGLHASCHALRELRLGTPTETREAARFDPAAELLGRVDQLQMIDLARRDECCGFGGVFAVEEEAVSTRMGLDRLEDHRKGRAELIASTDVSCLLHLEGVAGRHGLPIPVAHVAEILLAATLGDECLHQPIGGSSLPTLKVGDKSADLSDPHASPESAI